MTCGPTMQGNNERAARGRWTAPASADPRVPAAPEPEPDDIAQAAAVVHARKKPYEPMTIRELKTKLLTPSQLEEGYEAAVDDHGGTERRAFVVLAHLVRDPDDERPPSGK